MWSYMYYKIIQMFISSFNVKNYIIIAHIQDIFHITIRFPMSGS